MGTPAEVKANVKNVVILTQENRSFDEYFGTLNGANGFGQINPFVPAPFTLNGVEYKSDSVFYQPNPSASGVQPQYMQPWPYDTTTTSAENTPGCNHDWPSMHESWNHGQMNGWLLPANFVNSTNPSTSAVQPVQCMAYFTNESIPYHFELAETFTICDNYFASVIGPTGPNRLYLMSGSIGQSGTTTQDLPQTTDTPPVERTLTAQQQADHQNANYPAPDSSAPTGLAPGTLAWKSYAELLTQNNITWAVYDEDQNSCPPMDLNVIVYFTDSDQLWTTSGSDPTYRPGQGRFESDVAAGKLPQVSWIVPSYANTEHPNYTPANGIANTFSKVWALLDSNSSTAVHNYWQDTVMIVNYDEAGGAFDHVPPPIPLPGEADEWLSVSGSEPPPTDTPLWPIGPGFRSPTFVISQWSVGGRVCSVQYDHTSTLKFLALVTGVEVTLTPFRQFNFGDLSESLDFTTKSFPAPGQLSSFATAQTAAQASIPSAPANPPAAGTDAFPPPLYPPTPLGAYPYNPAPPLGGVLPLCITAAAIPGTSVFQLFYRGEDYALWTSWRNPDGTWSSEQSLGGVVTSHIAAADVPSTDTLQLFYRGENNALWSRWRYSDGTWSAHQSLGGIQSSHIAAVQVPGTAALQLFYRGEDYALWTRWRNPDGTWTSDQSQGGVCTSNISPAVVPGTDVLQLFYRGEDYALWTLWRNTDGTWSNHQSLDGILTSDIATATIPGSTTLQVFYRGKDNALWTLWRSPDGTWSGHHSLGGSATSDIAAAAVPNTEVLQLFYRGEDNSLWTLWRNSDGTWSNHHSLGGTLSSDAVAAAVPGTTTLQVYYRGADNGVWTCWRDPDGTWSGHHSLGGLLR